MCVKVQGIHGHLQWKMKKAILKPGKEISILRGHPWIFSGAIANAPDAEAGDWVEVFNAKGGFLACGHWSHGSIAIRIVSRQPIVPNQEFWFHKLKNCLALRQLMGFGTDASTNAYRLIHGEGDGLPGLICDMYGTCAVLQAHSHGMYRALPEIAGALQLLFDGTIETIYNKSRSSMHDNQLQDGWLLGDKSGTIARENGLEFHVNWTEGQKTGFFLDQRENRLLLSKFSRGKTVLNTFSYSGGFSVYALQGGAAEVASVDVSEKAIRLAEENVALLGAVSGIHTGVVADVPDFLKNDPRQWDIVILDPPAFAKNLKKKHSAVMGYKRLNELGFQRVKPGGLLFTFSCSQVIDDELFRNTITAAGMESGRNVRILYRLSQGPDHPVNLYHPEGSYLKGLVLMVD